ncbi:PHB depolymerase family esterase [Xanthobacter sp. DSM 24535]|uniref:extracellular catalytic domain type 1 short-chain-length polyhydroxyalkanoate depolymerase n=1 Tax=Roseixanthobacter psychrophilus TaxID=3119917 RepID=UPI00372CCEB1
MHMPNKIDMMEATRLTREGRLEEAVALLRRAVGTEPGAGLEAGLVAGAAQSGASVSDYLSDSLKGFFAPPAPAPAGTPGRDDGAFRDHVYANAAGSRTYKLYVPSRYGKKPLPLLVMLHGCTQSPDDFAAGTRMNEVAEEHGLLVAYPAQVQSANASKCWNWFNAADQKRGQGEPSLIAGITRDVMANYAVAPGRVYVAGLSAGGAVAAILGTTYPDLYAAIGVHSGLACGAASDMSSAFTAMRQGGAVPFVSTADGARGGAIVPTIVFHGDRDNTVHPTNGEHVVAQSKGGATLDEAVTRGTSPDGTAYSRRILSDRRGRAVLEHWVLHGLGHAWSGGSQQGSYADPRGPDASREMVRFFLQHTRIED